jgi:cobalt-zinc-cadmium efflux system membrane fusion protein
MMRVLLIAALAAACRADAARAVSDVQPEDELWLSPQQMKGANVRVAEARLQPLTGAITVAGRVAFNEQRVTHVFSPVTGRVTRVLAKPGQRVANGAPLIAIASPDVGTASSDLTKAQADLEMSATDFHREERLLREDATSRRSYEAAQDAYRKATAEYERARQRAAMLRAARGDAVTQDYVVRSHIDGDIVTLNVSPGMELAGQYSGGNSVELFTIGDIKNVWVVADVPDTDLPELHVGDPVEIRAVAYPGRVFHGAIELVGSTVDPVLRTVRVRCSLANEGGELRPEMFAAVSIPQPSQQRLAVPRDAVVAINETRYVYVQSNTRPDDRIVFKRRRVAIGDEHDGVVPITDGLQPGERVVIQGAIARESPNDEVSPTSEQLAEAHITTAKVEARDLADAVKLAGRLTFDDTRISHVFSPVNGRIAKVLAQPGQRVAKGAPLASIVSPDVGSYLADVAKAEADRTQAEHEYQRQRELYDAGVGAKRDLDAADDALRKARAEYDRARQLIELLRSGDFDQVSQEYVLRSPIAGEVIARKASPALEVQGQYSNGGSASNVLELFTIGELSELWVLADVYEIDLPRVTAGDGVTIRAAAYPGVAFHGRIDWVSDVLDPVQHTAKVRCVVDNHEHLLRPEMYEPVDVALPARHVLVVPRSAVMRVDGETVAFVQTGERKHGGGVVFRRRKVTARLDDNAALVPVFAGLSEGERVAVDHSLMLLGML